MGLLMILVWKSELDSRSHGFSMRLLKIPVLLVFRHITLWAMTRGTISGLAVDCLQLVGMEMCAVQAAIAAKCRKAACTLTGLSFVFSAMCWKFFKVKAGLH